MPLVVAFFVVSGISPVLSVLEKRLGVTRIVAAGLTFLAGVVVLIIFGCSIWVSMIDLSTNAQAYRNRVSTIVNRIESFLPQRLSFRDSITPVQSGAPKPTESSQQSVTTPADDAPSSQTPRSGTGDSETPSGTGEVANEKTKFEKAAVPTTNRTEINSSSDDTAKGKKAKPRSEKASKFVDQMVTYGITTLSQAFVSLVSTSVLVLI